MNATAISTVFLLLLAAPVMGCATDSPPLGTDDTGTDTDSGPHGNTDTDTETDTETDTGTGTDTNEEPEDCPLFTWGESCTDLNQTSPNLAFNGWVLPDQTDQPITFEDIRCAGFESLLILIGDTS